MPKKIYRFSTIKHFSHKYMLKDFKNANSENIDLGSFFRKTIFNEDLLKELFNGKELKFFQESLNMVYNIFNDFNNNSIFFPINIFFSFRILAFITNRLNSLNEKWNVNLSKGITHKESNFDPNAFNTDYLQEICDGNTDYFYKNIKTILDRFNISNSIIIIDFFWPSEIYQIIYLAGYFKKNGNIIIIDGTKGNEQLDYTNLIEYFKSNSNLFCSIDYFIVYNDYGYSEKNIFKLLSGELIKNLENVIYKDDKGIIKYYKLTDIQEKILFDQFESYYLNKDRIYFDSITRKRSIQLRLLPYGCPWRKCYFCTINSTNPFTITENYNDNSKLYINNFVSFVKENEVQNIYFTDEALNKFVINELIEGIEKEGLKIEYHFRIRFINDFTKKFCERLYQSGARQCSLGLESASQGINRLLNKGYDGFDVIFFKNILKNLESSGINIHIYSILGSPYETPKEITKTYLFHIVGIKEFNFYTCSPNKFGLMNGSFLQKNSKNFGIKENMKNKSVYSLVNNFHYINKQIVDNSELIDKYIDKIHKEQFIPWYYGNIDVYTDFWEFLDRTSLFYLIKKLYKTNPFKNFSENILNFDFNKEDYFENMILKTYYLQNISDGSQCLLYKVYNWIIGAEINLTIDQFNLLNDFDFNKTINENRKNSKIPYFSENIKELLSKKVIFLKLS